ncbi:DUF5009 domain-containing protein [Flavisolibacter tropicus]|uniref:DUF5009 domain-containing protein n=1 Tax=Flavisolibacter tropicus TaxID=1492898 RepID=A0A172TSI0_9BACT|nr:DUF5009 domain-containing protein [Flavisolibacter tropicus]ANE49990.1 hypothetical protein SY85_05260 [Flavisolibacter tropicus]
MKRNQSLDALRGFAILAMVLSGSIAFGDVLPAWMYHAQVPPPNHTFDPTLPGITWVDLVFPFFLFSMGAAIPLSLDRYAKQDGPWTAVLFTAARRYVLLTFFALFTFHMRAWVISGAPGTQEYLLSILGFILLFFQFYETKQERYYQLFRLLKVAAFLIAVALLYFLSFNGKPFSLEKSDIIILVLGNMAFFGTLIWWFTRYRPMLRIGILPFVMAVFLGGKESGSWNETLFQFSPMVWAYKFYYLKYLFIIIPGTMAGEWLLRAAVQKTETPVTDYKRMAVISILSFSLVILNVALLFSRYLVMNLLITVVVLTILGFLLRSINKRQHLMLQRFFRAGVYLLLLGLFFEAYEGGIKKDFSTYSYYFVTSGLAFFMLIGFHGLQLFQSSGRLTHYLSLNGRNPMVAYVAGNLLLLPLLHLTGGITLFESMNSNAWIGFLRGALFTGIVSLITIFFTQRKWFWKT